MQQPFSLHSLPKLCVAGGVVAGEVELNLQTLRDNDVREVHVKLRGSVHTMVSGKYGTMKETIPLLYRSMLVWAHGSAYFPSGSQTNHVPFKFTLPPNIPPSFDFMGMDTKGVVRYFLEVVGVRSGVLRMNKKCIFPLAVVPSDPSGAQLRSLLQLGWEGAWTTVRGESLIRKGLWGQLSKAILEFLLPSIEKFPLFTQIPFSLKVITFSKLTKRKNSSADKSIFPAPPLHPKEIGLVLKRKVHVCANQFDSSCASKVTALGGMGGSTATVNVVSLEKVWVPVDDNRDIGSWRQETFFRSTLTLQCPPTFRFDTLTNEYSLHVQVHFDGLFNTVEAEVPIKVVSGVSSTSGHDGRSQVSDYIDDPSCTRPPTVASREPPLSTRSDHDPGSLPSSVQANNGTEPPSPIYTEFEGRRPPPYIPVLELHSPDSGVYSPISPVYSPALDLPPSYWVSSADEWEFRHEIAI